MVNWGGAGQGAASGAMAGSTLGPWGAAGGAALGGVAGLMQKKPQDKMRQISNLTPEGQQYLSSIFGDLSGGQQGQNYGLAQQYQNQMLQGGPEAYNQWAAPYQTQFEEQTLPGIAERFSGLGGAHGGGLQSSSGFGQALGGAGAQFQSSLAGLYAQLQQHAAQQAFGQQNTLAGLGLGTSAFQPVYQPATPGAFGNITSGIMGGFAGAAGKQAGANFMNMFNKGGAATPGVTPATGGTP